MNVFITGGTSGIGAALAKLYASEGHKVGVCGRNPEKYEQNFKSLSNLKFYQADVSDHLELKKVIDEFVFEFGSLDVVYANAGIPTGNKVSIPNWDKARKVVDVNIKGVINAFDAALEHMYKQGHGQLVGLGSMAGYNGLPGVSVYAATKGAVKTICESLSIDLRKKNIFVTCITPGYIKTPLTDLNTHNMPWLMDVNKSALKIKRAVAKKKVLYAFPKQMYFLVRLLQFLPRSLYVYLMGLNVVRITDE